MWKPFDSAPQTGDVLVVRWLIPTADGRGAQVFALWRFEKESGMWQHTPNKKPARGKKILAVNRGALCYSEKYYPDEWFDFEATGGLITASGAIIAERDKYGPSAAVSLLDEQIEQLKKAAGHA